jgi:hypothetical protein
VPNDCSLNNTNPAAAYAPSVAKYRIPVVVHVIQNTSGTGNLSDALVQSQITVLNEDFRALAGTPGAGGVDTRSSSSWPPSTPTAPDHRHRALHQQHVVPMRATTGPHGLEHRALPEHLHQPGRRRARLRARPAAKWQRARHRLRTAS